MEFIHLTGTETVERAASAMQSAASAIQSAVGGLEWEVQKLSQMLDEKLFRLEEILNKKGGSNDTGH